ncbi:MFS transporter [Rhizomonospora bruguierae]|uniref:MFS transporter n=1 Tax=Rhizomonospora bruguierae TaxID=1581705 RepID=UPI001BCEDB8E|nr:MFS transporter [Micromonospora sp. NBRC 107566]
MNQIRAAEPMAKARGKEWIALGVLLLPVLLVSMDLTVLYFAVPSISKDLKPSGIEQLWILDIYSFVLAGLLLTMGALADRAGRRLMLLLGAAAFGVGSALASYATSPQMLIAARALQGIGGGTLMPSTLGLIRNIFHDQKQRRTAMALWSAGMAAGAALGPVVSGALLNQFWWGSVFLINVPVMAVLLLLGPVLLPEFRVPLAGRFDVLGAVLSLAAVLPVIYGFKKMAIDGVDARHLGSVAVGLVFLVLFVIRQRVATAPMVDLHLFRTRVFGPAVFANLLASFSLVGFSLFTTQYLQSVLGMRPLEAALWTLPGTVAVGMVVPVATVLVRKIRPAYLISVSFLISAAAMGLLTQVPVQGGLAMLLVGVIALAVGLTPVLTLITEMVVGAAPPDRAGSASAVLQTGQEFGGAFGVAVLGTVGAAVYRHSHELTAPAGVSAEALEPARETLGGALAVAAQLPEQAANAVITAARAAFTSELHAAALTGAVVMLFGAFLSIATLRSVKSDEQRAAEAAEAPVAIPVETPELISTTG